MNPPLPEHLLHSASLELQVAFSFLVQGLERRTTDLESKLD